MKQKKLNLLILPALLLSAGMSHAAVIAYVGVNTNVDSKADDTTGWHSTTNIKSLDADGDNALGTLGWHYGGNGTGGLTGVKSLPTSITTTNATTPNANVNAGGKKDGPTAGSPGINPAGEVDYNYWHNNSTTAGTVNVISFTIANATPFSGKTLRLGVLFDTYIGQTGSQTFTLAQTAGGSASAVSPTLSFSNDGMDAAFFDLTELATGNTFQLRYTNTGGSRGHVAGLTFDTVPEPSSALIGSLGLFALLRRRRA